MQAETCRFEKLAINGGSKIRTEPFPVSVRFAGDEIIFLKRALEQNTLFYFKGQMTKRFNEKFCSLVGSKYSVACSSGTAAIHTALGALGIGLGDEVITTSITDMGTVIGILYQNAVPVFCDNSPYSYGIDLVDLESKITPRTKAIIAVHLAGNPCDMDSILAIAKRHNLFVIEDCAQAWGCKYKGTHVGTFGNVGCFSTNDFKHISTGDGGVVCTNDEQLYKKLHLFADKHYNRFISTGSRDPIQLAPNYRWTELQAAVGYAQLDNVGDITKRRETLGNLLSSLIKTYPGIMIPEVAPDATCSYWFYMFRIDESIIKHKRDHFAACLQAEGIPVSAGYISHPIYKYPVFRDEQFFANGWPVKLLGLTKIEYKNVCCTNAEDILKTAVLLHINESFTEKDIYDVASAIEKVSYSLAARNPS